MDLIDLFVREFRTGQLERADALEILALLVLHSAAVFSILDVLGEVILAGQAGFSGLQFASFMGGYLVLVISNLASKRKVVDMFEDLIFNIRRRLMENMRQMELESFEKIGGPAFFNVLTLDVRYISDIANILWFLLSQGIIMAGVLLYMASLSLPVFAIVLMILILGFLAFLVMQSLLIKAVHTARDRESSLFRLMDGLFLGFKELRIDGRRNEAFFRREMEPAILAVGDLRRKAGYIRADTGALIQTIWSVMLLFIVFVLPYLGLLPEERLFPFTAAALFLPVVLFLNNLNHISFANISIDRIFRFEERLGATAGPAVEAAEGAPGPEFGPMAPPRHPPKHPIGLICKGLRFDYTDEAGETAFSLGPLDMRFASGEICFIAGGNGSGKTTLLKSIMGLYRPLAGTVAIDGRIVEPGEQRELFSCIFSDFHLFDRLYGLKNIHEKRVSELIRRMGLRDRVNYREGGFSTLALSAGQKKRLALIGALLEDKPFYVFDEWAAEQSPEFREYFYNILLPDLKDRNKLIICVTHDDHYYHLADRIYKLELGKLAPATASARQS